MEFVRFAVSRVRGALARRARPRAPRPPARPPRKTPRRIHRAFLAEDIEASQREPVIVVDVGGADMNARRLSGHVEIDGAYFGGYLKPRNRVYDRVDRRLKEH